jgi:hypothetical protein
MEKIGTTSFHSKIFSVTAGPDLKYFYLNLFLYQDMPDMLSPEACHRKNSPELDATQRKQYFLV